MSDAMYPKSRVDIMKLRKELAPESHDAFVAFSKQVFKAGKTKQLIG